MKVFQVGYLVENEGVENGNGISSYQLEGSQRIDLTIAYWTLSRLTELAKHGKQAKFFGK